MSKKTEVDEDETPVAVNGWTKHRSRRQLRKQGMVNFKHLDHPPHRVRTFLGYALIAIIAFWVLHYGLHVG